MKEFRFTVENQPGALAKVAAALGEARVNIEGTAGIEGTIRLVADNPSEAREVLQNLGADFTEKEAVVIDIPNHPGELATLLQRLGDEGINVESSYAAVERNKLILAVDQMDRLKQILRIA